MLQRAGVIWIMSLLVIYGNNAVYVAQDIGSLRATVGSYMVLRFSQICFYAVSSVASHHHRAQNRAYFALMLIGICIWIPLLCETVSDRAKIVTAVIAILYEVSPSRLLRSLETICSAGGVIRAQLRPVGVKMVETGLFVGCGYRP